MSDDLEERVRRALDVRARQITLEKLRPAQPPTGAPAVRSWRRHWRTLMVVAAAAAVAVLAIWRPFPGERAVVPDAPAATVPSVPVPTPSLPTSPGGVTPPPVLPQPTGRSAASGPLASPGGSTAPTGAARPTSTLAPPPSTSPPTPGNGGSGTTATGSPRPTLR